MKIKMKKGKNENQGKENDQIKKRVIHKAAHHIVVLVIFQLKRNQKKLEE